MNNKLMAPIKLMPLVLLLWGIDAAASDGRFIVLGEGNTTCGMYLAHRRDAGPVQNFAYARWTQGFISGWNIMAQPGQKIRTEVSPDTILAYADKYCRDNPLDVFLNAASALTKDLSGKR